MVERDTQEQFPRNFLKSVACEIRFSPLLIVKDLIPKFQKEIREEFPGFGFGFPIGSPPIDSPAIQFDQWLFSSKDNIKQLKIWINKVTYVTTQYSAFKDLLDESLKYFGHFSTLSEIKTFSRVGLRYTNDYPLESEDSPFPEISKLFLPVLDLNSIKDKKSFSFKTETRWDHEGSKITCWNALEKQKDGKFHYIIDIDSYTLDEVSFNDLKDVITTLHEIERVEFHNNIKESFVNILRKED